MVFVLCVCVLFSKAVETEIHTSGTAIILFAAREDKLSNDIPIVVKMIDF